VARLPLVLASSGVCVGVAKPSSSSSSSGPAGGDRAAEEAGRVRPTLAEKLAE